MKLRNRKNRLKKNASAFAVVLFAVLTVYVISMMFMYVWGFYTSFKTRQDLLHSYLSLPDGWPWQWSFKNYTTVLENLYIPNVPQPDGSTAPVYIETLLFNTVFYTVIGTAINTFTTWLVAYLMVRFHKIKFNALLYTVNLMLMTIPVHGTLPAALKIFKLFNWYNNYSFIIFNNLAFTGTNLMYFHAFINGLGREFYEAAYVDGAGNFCIMTRITFPLTQSMFWVFFLTGAISRWNDYMTMVIWMPDYPTLAYGLFKASISSATELSFPPTQIAICMTLMLPMMVLFFMFQEQMLGNLRVGAIKG